jgi:two-component system, chemotaxis family, protein-glutamate methylesterase/glutaminase
VTQPGKSRVLIVDDSAVMRRLLARSLEDEQDIDVVAEAGDAFTANELIAKHRPDLVTLDLEMPRLDGLTFLRHLMKHNPVPVIVISSHTRAGSAASIEALRVGAIDALPKPRNARLVAPFALGLKRRVRELRAYPPRLRGYSEEDARPGRRAPHRLGLVAVGASTGGPQALERLLSQLPPYMPPIVIVQHMPAEFTRSFARRLDETTPIRVIEAAHQSEVLPGMAYVAPGDHHLTVEQTRGRLQLVLRRSPRLHHQRPSVDVLFQSLVPLKGVPTLAVLLTGMGEDGADGMVALSQAGHETIAQDEQSCVVFGMPREAITRGGARHVASLDHIPALVTKWARDHDQPVAAR